MVVSNPFDDDPFGSSDESLPEVRGESEPWVEGEPLTLEESAAVMPVPLGSGAFNPKDERLPHALEAEQAFLGSAINNTDTVLPKVSFLQPGHFYDPVHQRVYEVILRRWLAGEPVNAFSLLMELRQDEALLQLDLGRVKHYTALLGYEVKDGPQYIVRLTAADTGEALAEAHAEVIVDAYQRRQAAQVLGELHRACYGADGITGEEVIRRAQEELGRARLGDRTKRTLFTGGESARARIEQLATHEQPVRFFAGSIKLDRLIRGFQPSNLYILAARPGMGKTACGVSWAIEAAKKGHGIAYFSLEMSAQQLTDRALCHLSYSSGGRAMTYDRLGAGEVNDFEIARLNDAAKRLEEMAFAIEEKPALNLHQVRMTARAIAQRYQRKGFSLDIVVVDHIGLMRPMESQRGRRDLEMGEITAGLKGLAKELDCAVLALCQLNRGLEQRDNKRPTLSDLRDSGRIEEDADVVLFLYREAYYLSRIAHRTDEQKERLEQVKDCLEVIGGKNRHGKTFDIELFADMGSNHIRDLI